MSPEPTSKMEIEQAALRSLRDRDYASAIKYVNQRMEKESDDDTVMFAADTLLRAGDCEAALEWFDKYSASNPESIPHLWQRGITLYFLGRFDDAAKQFEVHRDVNPNDVENAAWHYLCVSRAESVEKADELLLPAPNDPRPTMEEVMEMFRSGNTADVVKKMETFDKRTRIGAAAWFYGRFYLAMYADAQGRPKDAKQFMSECAADAPWNYMGDIARLYLKRLDGKAPKS